MLISISVARLSCHNQSKSNILDWKHRVDRVPGFLSSLSNWLPPPPPASECCPPPFGSKGGDTLAYGRGGQGGPVQTKGQTLWYFWYTTSIIPLRLEGSSLRIVYTASPVPRGYIARTRISKEDLTLLLLELQLHSHFSASR